MNYREILKKVDNGDAITDDELAALLKQLKKAADALEPLRYEPYRLILGDIHHEISRLESYQPARER